MLLPTQRASTLERELIPHHETPLKGSWAPQTEEVGVPVEVGVLEL